MKAERIVVAMSGGVDSSTAAALLQEAGHEVVGVTLKLTDATGKNLSPSKVTVHAVGIYRTLVAPAPGGSQPGQNFRFINSSPS